MINSINSVNYDYYVNPYQMDYNYSQNNADNSGIVGKEAETSDSQDTVTIFSPSDKVIAYLKSDVSKRYGIDADDILASTKNKKTTSAQKTTSTQKTTLQNNKAKESQNLLIQYLMSGLSTKNQDAIKNLGSTSNKSNSGTNSLSSLISYLSTGINTNYTTVANNLKNNTSSYISGLTT